MDTEAPVIEGYKVKTHVFEGPLDLLLNLIESRKLFINEISLSKVTDDYVSYVRSFKELHIADITSFVLIAATLILIKSRSLIPNLELSDEEEAKIIDLEARLKMYQVIKEVGAEIKARFGKDIIYFAPERKEYEPVFAPDPLITKERMYVAIEDVIATMPKKEFLPEVTVRKVISIEEMIGSLTDRIQSSMTMSFKDFTKGEFENEKEQKVYVIVGFLAMLELVREGILDVLQSDQFADMTLKKTSPNEIEINEQLIEVSENEE